MRDFKKGDMLECVVPSTIYGLTKGKLYAVLDVDAWSWPDISCDNQNVKCLAPKRFTLAVAADAVVPTPAPAMSSPAAFKISAVLECIDTGSYRDLTVGNLYDVEGCDAMGYPCIQNDVGDRMSYSPSCFTPYTTPAYEPPKAHHTDCPKCSGTGLIGRACGCCGTQWKVAG